MLNSFIQTKILMENEPYSMWWPVVVSTNPAYIYEGRMPVLCLPLLGQNSRKPWLTHPDRIIFMPDAVQTCTPSGAPQPAAAARQPSRNAPTSLAASIIEQDLTEFWDSQGEEGESPSTSPNEKAMEVRFDFNTMD